MPNSTRASTSRATSASSSSSCQTQGELDGDTSLALFAKKTSTPTTTTNYLQAVSLAATRVRNDIGPTILSKQSPRTSALRRFGDALTRKKPLDGRTGTNLNRCLNLLDLTTLGVGSTLGLGLYVLAGQVASNKAGPAVVISFALAALASAFSALCYAEFAGRVPRAGSAYAYSYIVTGEFVAFIIGWNLILEYVIGASSVARGFSGYLKFVYEHLVTHLNDDTIPASAMVINSSLTVHSIATVNNVTSSNKQLVADTRPSALNNTIVAATLWESISDYVCQYFDWTSIVIIIVLTVFILLGVKESTNLTLVFTSVNMIVVIVVVISSLGSLNLHNWQLKKDEIPPVGSGEGGFLPFGWSGVLAGSATCFFGFIGFDTIASSAEEAKDPKRNVPLSIVLSLFISFLAYMAIAIVQTLLWPYYAQDNITILPYIFAQLNMPITYWVVLLGAVSGLASSQIGGMYPLPRILYSMAQDKLIYASLAKVNRRLKLPVRATIIGSISIALLACLLDIQDLADMVSIGTLAAYSLVSLSVLIIRYEDRSDAIDDSTIFGGGPCFKDILGKDNEKGAKSSVTNQISKFEKENWKSPNVIETKLTSDIKLNNNLSTGRITQRRNMSKPTDATSSKSKVYISLIVVLTISLNLVAIGLTSWTVEDNYVHDSKRPYASLRSLLAYAGILLSLALFLIVHLLSKLPTDIDEKQAEMFMVPWVPLTPTLSIFVNTFLMLNLSYLTWIRFAVWMAVGLFIYFSYGIWHSEGYLLRSDKHSAYYDDRQKHAPK